MTKAFHARRAAQNGLTAALMAGRAHRRRMRWKARLGSGAITPGRWQKLRKAWAPDEAALNTYKPFACGIVTHPPSTRHPLRNENNLRADDIASVTLHLIRLSVTDRQKEPPGLEGKFGVYHCVAVGLIFGAAGTQFQDNVVRDPRVMALRRKVSVQTDKAVDPAQCDLTIKLKDGRSLSRHIQDAIGSLKNPMSDTALEAKFLDLTDEILPPPQAKALIATCRTIDQLADAGMLALGAAT